MAHQSFISIVGVLQSLRNVRELTNWLRQLYAELSVQFSDFEFVVVNNCCDIASIDAAIQPLPEALRKHIEWLKPRKTKENTDGLG